MSMMTDHETIEYLMKELAALRLAFEEYKIQHALTHQSIANQYHYGYAGNQ